MGGFEQINLDQNLDQIALNGRKKPFKSWVKYNNKLNIKKKRGTSFK